MTADKWADRYRAEGLGGEIHVDVKKLGKVSDGSGWRDVGRQQSGSRAATAAIKHVRRPGSIVVAVQLSDSNLRATQRRTASPVTGAE